MSYHGFLLHLTGKPHKCLFCCFYTSSASNLYEIQAVAVTWSTIISYTPMDNFVRHLVSKKTEKRLSLRNILRDVLSIILVQTCLSAERHTFQLVLYFQWL